MSAPPKPPSITEVGLRRHLDINAESHNGYGYEDFVKMAAAGLDKSNMARAFNVNRATIRKWLEVYEQEERNGQK